MDAEKPKTSAAPPLSTAAISALHRGNMIEAIKIVREERNIGLKEAKEAVDDYVRSQPALQSSFAAQSKAKLSTLLRLAVLITLALLAYYFLAQP